MGGIEMEERRRGRGGDVSECWPGLVIYTCVHCGHVEHSGSEKPAIREALLRWKAHARDVHDVREGG